MKLIILTGITDSPVAINPNMVIGVRKGIEEEGAYKTNIDTNNFTYKVKEDFETVCAAFRNAGQ